MDGEAGSCQLLYTFGGDDQDYIAEDTFAHSRWVPGLEIGRKAAASVTFCIVALQLIIDVGFGHEYHRSLTLGSGDSIGSFMLVRGDNWNKLFDTCGVMFPKEKVFTEWLYGWMSAHDMSDRMLTPCDGCKGEEPEAVALDAVYVSVARSTLLKNDSLFSVCISLSFTMNLFAYLHLQMQSRPPACTPSVSKATPGVVMCAHRRASRSINI